MFTAGVWDGAKTKTPQYMWTPDIEEEVVLRRCHYIALKGANSLVWDRFSRRTYALGESFQASRMLPDIGRQREEDAKLGGPHGWTLLNERMLGDFFFSLTGPKLGVG